MNSETKVKAAILSLLAMQSAKGNAAHNEDSIAASIAGLLVVMGLAVGEGVQAAGAEAKLNDASATKAGLDALLAEQQRTNDLLSELLLGAHSQAKIVMEDGIGDREINQRHFGLIEGQTFALS